MARILIVGACQFSLEDSLRRITANPDNRLLFADTAANAVQKLTEPCDIVVTDLALEESQSGLLVLQSALQQNADARIIVCVPAGTVVPQISGTYDCLPQSLCETDSNELVDKITVALARPLILLAEDDTPLSNFITRAVEQRGLYNIHQACNSDDFIAKIKLNSYKLIILDLNLPHISGMELLAQVRADHSEVPIVILTADGTLSTRISAFTLGADAYITKPFSMSELLIRMELLLRPTQTIMRESERIKQLCDALAEENAKLKQSVSYHKKISTKGSKTSFDMKAILGAAGHDLKGELMHISSAVKNLRLMKLSSDALEDLDLIHRSAVFSQGVAQRLLHLSDFGASPMNRVSVGVILDDVNDLVRPRLSRNIRLSVQESPDIRRREVCDSVKSLTSALVELLMNASQSIGNKAGQINLSVMEEDDKIIFTVRDSGPGIPREIRKWVFKRQLASKRGAGLGLYLTARVIESLRGKLTLNATSENGTEFSISLPLQKED
jgi:DNA-binding response OmpR family regulator/anti-sigma regulatory factor (Ser/Thr protein kinase)